MNPMESLLLMLRPLMSYDYIVIQIVCWVELPEPRRLCSILKKNIDPDKWDTTMWYQVTRNPKELCRLTGCQRDPRIWGVIAWY